MSKKKIYISLPITGRDFDEVESEILYVSGVLEMKGYRVVTPIDFDVNPDLDKPYHELLGNGKRYKGTNGMRCDMPLPLLGKIQRLPVRTFRGPTMG